MKLITFLFCMCTCYATLGSTDSIRIQRMAAYLDHSHKAQMFSADKKYVDAIAEYKRAFEYYQAYVPDVLSCADSYEALGNMDSAFFYLNMAVANGFDWHEYDKLPGVKQSKVYDEKILIADREAFFKKINKDYLDILDSMVAADQSVRGGQLDIAHMDSIDATNMQRLAGLIDKYGFPRYETVGYSGGTDAFILMLHGFMNGINGHAMWEHFQSILFAKVKNGYLMPDYYAFLYDRVVSDYGRLEQCYGTQFSYTKQGAGIDRIYDIAHVDKRRAEIGLPPLSDMITAFHLTPPTGYVAK